MGGGSGLMIFFLGREGGRHVVCLLDGVYLHLSPGASSAYDKSDLKT